jgi:hypothetical protein
MSRSKKDSVAAALGKLESMSVSETASTLTAASGEPILSMKEKAALKKAARVAERETKKKEEAAAAPTGPVDVKKALASGTALPGMNEQQQLNAAARQATGVLITEKRARDIKISGFSLSLHSARLVEDTIVSVGRGRVAVCGAWRHAAAVGLARAAGG